MRARVCSFFLFLFKVFFTLWNIPQCGKKKGKKKPRTG